MTMKMDAWQLKATLMSLVLALMLTATAAHFNDHQYHTDKVLLSDVKALTLHHGQMTNARRSPPVPQLKCVGGSAQHKFTPKVVQCINRGSDGYDIQWECKTDMDNAYRFGHVEVSCEGYDYPNDPYVLKGSCGLEYTIEFTEEGWQREKQKGGYSHQGSYGYQQQSQGGSGGLVVFGFVLMVMYVIYKACLAPQQHATPSAPEAEQPPPYGFRPEFSHPTGPPPAYDSHQSGFHTSSDEFPYHGTHTRASRGTGAGGGGFWSGAATGGVLGYLFGRSGNNYGYHQGYRQPNSWFGNSGWGNNQPFSSPNAGSFFSSSSSTSSRGSSGSSGTRTASGFGGTSRR